ncbi:unnamed protein product [Rotaria socialis]|uniref:Metalloendopeptidase n=1 Tax=Rotaria socialis TaxID=392032 RepID=A0A817ZIY3_9BILA|nr:unnamed protein product [Rotaria socialis]
MTVMKLTMINCWIILKTVTLVSAYPSQQFLPGQVKDGEYLVGGDMIFPTHNMMRGVAQSTAGTRWTNGIVPYVMSTAFTAQQQTLITGAMRNIERLTAISGRKCVQFRPKIATDRYSILIKTGRGCSSHVGQNTGWTGQLQLTLQVSTTPQSSHCMYERTIMHELLHTLGFNHEHQRSDRDSFLTINYANIQNSYVFAFDKLTSANSDNQGTPYDYNSIMHYGRKAFSSNGQPTMVPKNPTATIGVKTTLSPIDIQEIQKFYQCK